MSLISVTSLETQTLHILFSRLSTSDHSAFPQSPCPRAMWRSYSGAQGGRCGCPRALHTLSALQYQKLNTSKIILSLPGSDWENYFLNVLVPHLLSAYSVSINRFSVIRAGNYSFMLKVYFCSSNQLVMDYVVTFLCIKRNSQHLLLLQRLKKS